MWFEWHNMHFGITAHTKDHDTAGDVNHRAAADVVNEKGA